MSQDRRKFLVSVLGALLAIAGLFSFAAGNASAKGGGNQPRLEGTLVAKNVAARRMTVRLQGGATRVLVIPATAKVERNGVTASLNAFKIGDRVQARFTADGLTVIKFEGTGL